VVGYSSGGKYAIACPASLPERVTRAGVLAGTGPPEIPGFRVGLGSFDQISMTLATRARPLALALWGLTRRMALGRPDRFLAYLEKETRGPDRAVLADPAMRWSLALPGGAYPDGKPDGDGARRAPAAGRATGTGRVGAR
jgi:pimeloyl-ACP methyl ester carboxylesterase